MPKNLTVRLDDELAADTEALARAEGQSLNETVKLALREAVERRVLDPHPGLDMAGVDLARVLRDQALHLARAAFRGGGGGVHASMSRSGRAVMQGVGAR